MAVLELNMSSSLITAGDGLRTCPICHWHGIPTFRDGRIQRECPSCGKPVIAR